MRIKWALYAPLPPPSPSNSCHPLAAYRVRQNFKALKSSHQISISKTTNNSSGCLSVSLSVWMVIWQFPRTECARWVYSIELISLATAAACSRFIVHSSMGLSFVRCSLLFQKFQHFVCHINIKYDFLSGFKCAADRQQFGGISPSSPFPPPARCVFACLFLIVSLVCGCQCGYLILFQVHIRRLKCVDVS